MVKVQVTWNIPYTFDITEIKTKAEELVEAGKAVGPDVEDDGDIKIVNWEFVDTDTANEWIAFVNTFSPVSAEIIG